MEVNLNAYVERGEVPTDPAVLEQLLNSWGKEPTEQDELATPAVAVETESAPSGAVDPKTDGVEKEPDGILSKDGKHVIPYDALKSERQAKQDLQAKLEAATRELEAAKAGKFTQTEINAFEGMSTEQLEEMKEYFPEQYEAQLKQQEVMRLTTQKLRELEQREDERKIAEAKQSQQTVQETIDNNPVLSHWQRNNPEAWEYCVAQDKIEQQNPINSKLTMAERFEKVVKKALIDFDHPFPESDKKESKPQNAPKTAQSEPSKPPINSLSSLKGGEPAEATLRERFDNLSPAEINAAMANMSAKQQDEFLLKLASNQ